MTVFGIGTLELVLILLLLILVFGPERITELARWLGQSYRRLTGVTNEINQQVSQVRQALNTAVDADKLTRPLRDLGKEINETQREMTQTIADTQQEVKSIHSELETEMTDTIDTPSEPAPDEPETETQKVSEVQS